MILRKNYKKIDKGHGTRELLSEDKKNVNTIIFFLNRITKTISCQNELNC